MRWKTSLTKIENEQEIIRGHNLQQLVQTKTFVEVIWLLLKGQLPNAAETRLANALFAAAIDHGVGAPSATVARMVASTGNSLHTAVAAGVQTLGERHGGAIEGAAEFFQENVNVTDVTGLVKSLKDKKNRIPGYGHKVLTHDHRADTLFTIAKETGGYGKHCTFAAAVGEALNKISSKPLPLNIDGAMGAIISDLGFDWCLAQGFFIIGRVPGLVAQVYEELTSGAGVRRLSEEEIEYIGQ
ncbi:MAG: citryl-CoA lyase [Candidatus Magasanikbacteria bacterium]|nr:citryl-CoA lyase [Candidatus Magasanikbacteria bacterium]